MNEVSIFKFQSGDLETVILVMNTIAKYWKEERGKTALIRNTPGGYEIYYNEEGK